jgi:hypothetical protein
MLNAGTIGHENQIKIDKSKKEKYILTKVA